MKKKKYKKEIFNIITSFDTFIQQRIEDVEEKIEDFSAYYTDDTEKFIDGFAKSCYLQGFMDAMNIAQFKDGLLECL